MEEIITSKKGLNFRVCQYQHYVCVSLEYPDSVEEGKKHVYNAIRYLKLKSSHPFILGKVASIIFNLENHDISEVKAALLTYPGY